MVVLTVTFLFFSASFASWRLCVSFLTIPVPSRLGVSSATLSPFPLLPSVLVFFHFFLMSLCLCAFVPLCGVLLPIPLCVLCAFASWRELLGDLRSFAPWREFCYYFPFPSSSLCAFVLVFFHFFLMSLCLCAFVWASSSFSSSPRSSRELLRDLPSLVNFLAVFLWQNTLNWDFSLLIIKPDNSKFLKWMYVGLWGLGFSFMNVCGS